VSRRSDVFGNLHTATDHRGWTVLRRPRPGYRGRHRKTHLAVILIRWWCGRDA
jgi:hypothetical protein